MKNINKDKYMCISLVVFCYIRIIVRKLANRKLMMRHAITLSLLACLNFICAYEYL